MGRLIRWSVVAATVLSLAILMPLRVEAGPPLVDRFVQQDTFVVPCSAPGLGGRDFDALVDITTKGVIQFFFDQDDNPTRQQIHLNIAGTQTNIDPDTGEPTGDVYRIQHAFTIIVDIENGTTTVVGLPFGLWGANGPPVILDRGRIVEGPDGEILFIAGPHPLLVQFGGNPCLVG